MSPAPKPAALRDSKLQLQSPQRALLSPNPKLSFRAEQAGDFSSLSLLREAGLRSREISLLPIPKLSFRAEQAGDFSSLSLLREAGLRSREISLRSPGFSVDSSPRASLLARRQ